MVSVKKLILSTLGLGAMACTVALPITACNPIYVILRDIDFSKGDVGDDTIAPTNSRIIDATNTLLYMTDYDFENNPNDIPDGVRPPIRISQGVGYAHFVLFAGDVAYTIKVTASINYQGNFYERSITVSIKATTD
ncbi:MAG: hypothetical protein LBF36_03210 [Mycoplasmataceae bacterium]|jgi:hypothetical protein|nr:hypothetical protein [Mycoplasmataceae bacterium]